MTRTSAPANSFAALWLERVTTSQVGTFKGIAEIATWLAANVDQYGDITASKPTIGYALGIAPDVVRTRLQSLRKGHFLTSTVNATRREKRAPSTYHLALPASVVEAELEALASQEVGA